MNFPQVTKRKLIWDFGMRGKKAKELHVNGSGIGLFTVKKIDRPLIADEHGGVREKHDGSIDLPKVNRLKAELGLLI